MANEISLGLQSYKSDSLPLSAQRCINAYAEIQPKGAKTPVAVKGHPGIPTFGTLGSGPVRGMFEMNGIAYAVSGTGFYSIDADGNGTLLGTGITGINVVSIDGNGFQVGIVNGVAGFIYDTTTATFAQIADGDFQPANTLTFLDSYFVYDWKDMNRFFLSGLLDGTIYDALDYASAESSPDRVLAVRAHQSNLLLLGEKTIEYWNHTGALNFPFQRFDGATVQRGILAPLAHAAEDNALFFAGNDRISYRLNGLNPIRISTHAIETEWETYTTVDDAFCFPVAYGGHKFIYTTFPTEGVTFGYDIATGLWHERMSFDATGAEAKWRINCSMQAYGRTLVGDANSGKIGYLDAATFTEFGDPIRMLLTSPPIHGGGLMGFMPKFEIDMESGVGNGTGQGADPQAMLDWSDDGGHTFCGPQLWRSMGKVGEYKTRLRWDELGCFEDSRIMRLQVTDPVKRVVFAARAPGLYFS